MVLSFKDSPRKLLRQRLILYAVQEISFKFYWDIPQTAFIIVPFPRLNPDLSPGTFYLHVLQSGSCNFFYSHGKQQLWLRLTDWLTEWPERPEVKWLDWMYAGDAIGRNRRNFESRAQDKNVRGRHIAAYGPPGFMEIGVLSHQPLIVDKFMEVQLDLTPENEVFRMLFEGCHTKNR